MKKFLSLFLTASLLVSGLTVPIAAENEETADYNEADITVAEEYTQSDGYMFTLPENMKAAILTPEADFMTEETADNETIMAELDLIYADYAEIGLNTVIINSSKNGVSYYSTDMNSVEETPLSLAVSTAYNHGVSPYVILDIGELMSGCEDSARAIDYLISEVHRFTLKYPCDGIILDGYYMNRDVRSYEDYMKNGSGIGYENWLYDTSEQYFRTAAEIIHETNNSVAVGIAIRDVWANSVNNEGGSKTDGDYEALYDGYSDTKAFLEKGYADFAVLSAYGSLSSIQLPYEEVTSWWNNITEAMNMPLYIIHHNDRIGGDGPGWKAEDQLLRQLTVAKKLGSYKGSIFNSYTALKNNPLNTTTTLKSYFNEQIDESSLFEDLRMTSPAKLNFTTSEQSVTFMGTFDNNFPVYFNGQEITLNDAGNFYFKKELKVGKNTFTIKHKSKTLTYTIERKIVVMKSISKAISDGKTLRVEGGTKIKLTATAYRGSKVYGIVNGTTVSMSESSVYDDEDDVNSSYVRYTGTYTAPEGLIGQEQALGAIKIYGSNSGYSVEVIGASVVVNAKPEPPKQQEQAVISDASSVGTGEIIGTLGSPHKASEALKYVKTNANYTIVYDGKTADDIPSPIFSQLPAGVKEVYKATSGNYYITESGKRFAMSASTVEEGYGIEENPLFVKAVGTSGGNSYIKLSLGHKTGFNMRLAGNSYYSGWDGDYNVSDLTATHLYITFENVTSVTKLPSFENNLVFRSGKWDTVTEDNGTKFRLILELRQPGVYFGHSAVFNSDGDLVLSFPVPTNSLSGLTIVVDPGHGYGKFANLFDPGAIGEVRESDVVLPIAEELTAQLKAAGANVIRLKSESQFLLTKERPNYARGYGCDLYLSIHANKATGEARGVEAYYFTSYSQPLAKAISANIANYYAGNVYSDGANKDRGAKYSYYQVTLQQDFPSVLIETGFVDNISDAMALNSKTHQKGIAAAIVAGIKQYISRSNITYAQEGSSTVTKPDNEAEETKPEETEATDTEPEVTDSAETTDNSEAVTDETTAPTEETTVPTDVWGGDNSESSDITTLPPDTPQTDEATEYTGGWLINPW